MFYIPTEFLNTLHIVINTTHRNIRYALLQQNFKWSHWKKNRLKCTAWLTKYWSHSSAKSALGACLHNPSAAHLSQVTSILTVRNVTRRISLLNSPQVGTIGVKKFKS